MSLSERTLHKKKSPRALDSDRPRSSSALAIRGLTRQNPPHDSRASSRVKIQPSSALAALSDVSSKAKSSGLRSSPNLIFSLLGTGGAASVAFGLGAFGAVNIWNPIGWITIGAAVLLAGAVALAVKNKSTAWMFFGLLPGINILAALLQPYPGNKKQSSTSVLQAPLSISVPRINSSIAPSNDRKRATVPRATNYRPSSHSTSTSSAFFEEKRVNFKTLIAEQRAKVNEAFSCALKDKVFATKLPVQEAKRIYKNYNDKHAYLLNQVVDLIVPFADGDSNADSFAVKLAQQLLELQILEETQLLPAKLAHFIYDSIIQDKNYHAINSLLDVLPLVVKKRIDELSHIAVETSKRPSITS